MSTALHRRQLTGEQWQRLLLASAYRFLQAREDLKPRKQQSVHDVLVGALLHGTEDATREREELVQQQVAVLAWARKHAATSDAAERALAVMATVRRIEVVELGAPSCAFTNAPATLQCTLIDLARTDLVVAVADEGWAVWLEALMMTANALAWIDAEVARVLDDHPSGAQLTEQGFQDRVLKPLLPKQAVFNRSLLVCNGWLNRF
jgi:hypothetical protein